MALTLSQRKRALSLTLAMVGLLFLGLLMQMTTANPIAAAGLSGTVTPVPTYHSAADLATLNAVPPPADLPAASSDNIVTALLIGSDTIEHLHAGNTDVLIVVAVDRTLNTVSMLHIPRDMYVYMPDHGMTKINAVMGIGNAKYGDGQGGKALADTVLYNFGIKIDFWAHVDMVSFEDLVKSLGGLDITVDCAIQGHRLINVKGDYNDPKNWELYTLPIGERKLDPYMALWYTRTRYQSSDLDRGRRQMEVLRAMWRQARQQNIFSQVTTLFPQALKYVETNLTLPDAVGFAPTALSLNPNDIYRIDLVEGRDYKQDYSPDNGAFILWPLRDGWKIAAQTLLSPPIKNRLSGESPTVAVGAAPLWKGYDQTAADRLAWDGFATSVIGTQGVPNRAVTVVYDYTGGSKPSSLKTLIQDLRIPSANVVQQPDPNATVDFRVEMGGDYGKSCLLKLPDLPDTPQ